MVARTRSQSHLTVSFWRSDECLDAVVVATADEAYSAALRLLGHARPLQGGDRLTVTYDDGPDLPETSHASHYSG